MRRAVVLFVLLTACKRSTPSPPVPAEAAAPSLPASSSAAVSVAAAPAEAGPAEFESLFDYGSSEPAKVGPSDPARLKTSPGYESYSNSRFGFVVDVPRAFTAMPAPDNGDGMSWRLGDIAAMTASGMNWVLEEAPPCEKTPHVSGFKKTKTSCWRTGVVGDFIYWERWELQHDVLSSLRFQYKVSMKDAMDPVVTHVAHSWKP